MLSSALSVCYFSESISTERYPLVKLSLAVAGAKSWMSASSSTYCLFVPGGRDSIVVEVLRNWSRLWMITWWLCCECSTVLVAVDRM